MRLALVLTVLVTFTALGAMDLLAGNPRVGVAALLLAGANALLLL